MTALSSCEVDDRQSGKKVKLRDHPTLVSVDAPIVGLQGLRDMNGSVTRHQDYTREKFIAAVLRSVAASRRAFANDFGFMAFFRIDDLQGASQPLDQAVFEQLQSHFMQPGGLGLGLMQELWSDEGPRPDGLGLYLTKLQAPNAVMLQALTSWTRPFTNPAAVASGNPDLAFSNAYSRYGARYFEMYYPDIVNPRFATILEKWSRALTAKH